MKNERLIVDGEKLIARQLSIDEKCCMDFGGGHRTELTPVKYSPQLDGEAWRLPLDGQWKVSKWPFKQKEEALVSPKTVDAKWSDVAQPGKVFYYNPEVPHATIKSYNRVSLEHIDPEDGAVLRRTARLPKSWQGKRVFLCFDAIYPAGRVYLNGKLLGEHTSGLTPAEWDVTGLVTPGREALVAVRLLRKHKFVKLDMPRHALEFAGLGQPAYFHAMEPCRISDYHLIPDLASNLRAGSLSGALTVLNQSPKTLSGTVTVTLADPKGKRAATQSFKFKAAPGGETALKVKIPVKSPMLWNDEFPNLYAVTLALKAPGQQEQEIKYRTGFRRFELKGERPMLNGAPVKFRGVNHLTYHPEFGMHTPTEWLRRDLELMKRANVNAIRTHFLGPRRLAELCGELGIYLLQELPIDWGTNYIHNPEWVGPAMQRLQGGILRDRHQPAVMVWSVGNENMPESLAVSADGYNHLRIYDRFAKTLDPSRPTMFPPPGPANKIEGIFEVRVGDIGDTHYSFNLVKKYLKSGKVTNPKAWTAEMETHTKEEAMALGWSGVWFSSEYGIFNMHPDVLNAPYHSVIADVKEDILSGKNSQQAFIDRQRSEWGFLRHEPTCLGGAYFPWMCSGAGNNPWGWVYWGEDNDWGVVAADLTPKSFFWGLRALFSPVWFPERIVWRKGDKTLRFEAWNQYNAIDLKDCVLRTLMGGGGNWMGSLNNWKDVPVSCPPGEKREISIPIWNSGSMSALEDGNAIVCRCVLLDPKGFRPIMHDIIVMPEKLAAERDAAMPIGPDAIM